MTIKCDCGNPEFGFPCACQFMRDNPGSNEYSCEYCGIYTASKARCSACEASPTNVPTTDITDNFDVKPVSERTIQNAKERFMLDFLAEFATLTDLSNTRNNRVMISSEKSYGSVYLRFRHRVVVCTLDGKDRSHSGQCLDIANISLLHTGKGIGSYLINFIHTMNPGRITFIENVVNPRFAQYLQRNNWIKATNFDYDTCFFKLTGE